MIVKEGEGVRTLPFSKYSSACVTARVSGSTVPCRGSKSPFRGEGATWDFGGGTPSVILGASGVKDSVLVSKGKLPCVGASLMETERLLMVGV